jgi:hypothetical protein
MYEQQKDARRSRAVALFMSSNDEVKSTEEVNVKRIVYDHVLRFFRAEGQYQRATRSLAKSPMEKSSAE